MDNVVQEREIIENAGVDWSLRVVEFQPFETLLLALSIHGTLDVESKQQPAYLRNAFTTPQIPSKL